MKPHVFIGAIILGVVFFGALAATGASESQLVMASSICVPLIVFGVAGIIAAKRKAKTGKGEPLVMALMLGSAAGLALWFFFMAIWPSL